MIDDETLLAFLDGELEPARAAAVEAAVATDSALASRLEAHRRLGARLRRAFDPVLKEAVPERLTSASRGEASVIDQAEARALRQGVKTGGRDWRAVGAIAAALVVSVAVGQAFLTSRPASVIERDGRLIASGDLARALDTQLAGDGGRVVRVQLTFRNREGAICRGFTGATADGVACRQDGRWTLKALFAGEKTTSGDYRMASAGDPHVMQVVDDMIADEPLGAAQERAAKTSGWMSPIPSGGTGTRAR
jgi:hypothetical protein